MNTGLRFAAVTLALTAILAFCRAEEARVKLEFVQVLKGGDEGCPKGMNAQSLQIIGDFLYGAGGGDIHYFKRDAQTGKLTYTGSVPGMKDRNASLCAAGGRLYADFTNYTTNTIVWYDIEPQTGKPIEKEKLEDLKDPWSGPLVADPEGKNLYAAGYWRILRFDIGADGKPVKANGVGPWPGDPAATVGVTTGKGVGAGGAFSSVRMSPDGRFLYSADNVGDRHPANQPFSIACFERKPGGELVSKQVTTLPPDWSAQRSTMVITPDGKWLYAAFWNDLTASHLAIYRRDSNSGDLTLQEAGSAYDTAREDFKIANALDLNLVFLPDGTGGFAGSASGSLLQTFQRDPNTGRLSNISDFVELDAGQYSSTALTFDPKLGLLYGAGSHTGSAQPAIWAAKLAKSSEPARPRSDLKIILANAAGSNAPAKPSSSDTDWLRWRGPTGNGKNFTKGIRKDWTGGLKKVWEIGGLNPGTCTYSGLAAKGNKLILTGRHGGIDEVFCFDAEKGGMPLWIAEYATSNGGDYGWGDGPQAAPCIGGDKVYVSSRFGQFVCLSLTDGNVLWKIKVGGNNHGYAACPLVCDNLVVVPGVIWTGFSAALMAGLQKDTGEIVWKFDGDKADFSGEGLPFSSPMLAKLDGKDQIIYQSPHRVVGVDPHTGLQTWEYVAVKNDLSAILSPVADGNTVVAMAGNTRAFRIEGGKPTELWSGFKSKTNYALTLCDPIVINGYVYVFLSDGVSLGGGGVGGFLVCVDLKNGELKWAEKTGAATTIEVDGCLLCLTFAGDLLLVDPKPEAFVKIAEQKNAAGRNGPWIHRGIVFNKDSTPCWTQPLVACGKVYVRWSDHLTCYDLSK